MKNSRLRLLLPVVLAILVISCGTNKTEDVRREVTLQTTKGDIVVQLFNETPLHRDNFLQHVQSGYYDSLLFHRVIADFMIQSGDSTSRHASPDELIADESDVAMVPAEFRYPDIFHKRGMLAAARTSDDVNPDQSSSAAQFYIVWGKTYNDSLLNKIDSIPWHVPTIANIPAPRISMAVTPSSVRSSQVSKWLIPSSAVLPTRTIVLSTTSVSSRLLLPVEPFMLFRIPRTRPTRAFFRTLRTFLNPS